MQANQLTQFEIDTEADVAGIRPEDITNGIKFVLDMNEQGLTCTVNERASRTGGNFKQYTLHGKVDGVSRRLSFLFEKDLAPIARAWGRNPASWVGKTLFVQGVQKGAFWNVEMSVDDHAK